MQCLEDVDFGGGRSRTRIFSMVAGMIFAVAWWVFIDAAAVTNATLEDPKLSLGIKPVMYLPGIGTSLAFIAINTMDWSALNADEFSHYGGSRTRLQARGLLTFAILFGLGSIIGAIVLFSNVYANKQGWKGQTPDSIYPGAAVFVQSTLIFIAGFIMRFGRANDNDF
jgi:heme/copper-type cytochrome/quinol oxidase subunit 3